MNTTLRLVLAACLLISISCTHSPSSQCVQKRGALDVGSGTTKALGAEIDLCERKIIKVLFKEQTPIPFRESLKNSRNFSSDVIEEGRVKYTALVRSLYSLDVKKIRAVATAAFRQAENGETARAIISEPTGVEFQVIDQQTEARLGLKSARIVSQNPKAAVWDIGGGSMQITLPGGKNDEPVYLGEMASVSFKEFLIRNLHGKDPTKTNSPNPIRRWAKAAQLARSYARKNLPPQLRQNAASYQWVGIGGVWWHSVHSQVTSLDTQITQSEIRRALKKRAFLGDREINSPYAATEVSNLALVLGFMEAMKIESIETVDASLVQALLFESK